MNNNITANILYILSKTRLSVPVFRAWRLAPLSSFDPSRLGFDFCLLGVFVLIRSQFSWRVLLQSNGSDIKKDTKCCGKGSSLIHLLFLIPKHFLMAK